MCHILLKKERLSENDCKIQHEMCKVLNKVNLALVLLLKVYFVIILKHPDTDPPN